MLHAQGDHLFNDWRDVFADLGPAVARASGKPQIGARVTATFAAMLASPRVDQARQLTVKCVGHPADFDLNAYQFGHTKSDFKTALINYALTRTIGVMSAQEQAYRPAELGRSFRALTAAAIDEDAVARFLTANPGRRGQVDAARAFYLREAPQAFETLLAGAWEPAGF